MKKLVCILCVLLCLYTCAVPCFAATQADVVLTLTAEQQPKENVVVSVVASKDSAMYTTEFFINYATDDFRFIKESAVPGEAVKELTPYITAAEVAPGKIKVSYTGTKPLEKQGAICQLEFRALRTTISPLFIEIEHAETFDGEHIRSLTTQGVNTRVSVTEQPVEPYLIAIFVAVLVVGVVVVVVIAKKKNGKNKQG